MTMLQKKLLKLMLLLFLFRSYLQQIHVRQLELKGGCSDFKRSGLELYTKRGHRISLTHYHVWRHMSLITLGKKTQMFI